MPEEEEKKWLGIDGKREMDCMTLLLEDERTSDKSGSKKGEFIRGYWFLKISTESFLLRTVQFLDLLFL